VLTFVIFGIPLLCCASIMGFEIYLNWRTERNWQRFLATEIPTEITKDFCDRNLVPADIGDCNQQILYGDIRPILQANLSEESTYADVDRLISEYERYCERRTELNRLDRYHCTYWIGTYSVRFFFDGESDAIVSILWDTPDDS